MAELTDEQYMVGVLDAFAKADLYDSLLWRVDDGRVRFLAVCSDTFAWDSVDVEEIEPGDLPLLRQCLADLQAIGDRPAPLLSELFAARKRRMRPMRWWFNDRDGQPWVDPGARALFDACGPERTPAQEGWTVADDLRARVVEAPFTPDQVASLNAFQTAGVMHPFTCGGEHEDGRVLVATPDGWRCPAAGCGYRQGWAHAFTADWSWRDA